MSELLIEFYKSSQAVYSAFIDTEADDDDAKIPALLLRSNFRANGNHPTPTQ